MRKLIERLLDRVKPRWQVTMFEGTKRGMWFTKGWTQRGVEADARRRWGHHFGANALYIARRDTCGGYHDFIGASNAARAAVSSNMPPASTSAASAPSTSDTTKSAKQ